MQEPEPPKVSPAWIAALFAIIGVIGAVTVFLFAKAGHVSDDQQIADYDRATTIWFAVADEAVAAFERGEPFDRERLEDAVASIEILSTPGILDPLHERDIAWLRLLTEANQALLDGDTEAFGVAFQGMVAARADADRERAEIHCNADPSTC